MEYSNTALHGQITIKLDAARKPDVEFVPGWKLAAVGLHGTFKGDVAAASATGTAARRFIADAVPPAWCVLTMSQGHPVWHALRSGAVTSTTLGSLLGMHFRPLLCEAQQWPKVLPTGVRLQMAKPR